MQETVRAVCIERHQTGWFSLVKAAAVGLALLLSACVVPVPRPDHPVDLATLADWRASGRMAVAAAGSGGSGSFKWQQQGTRTTLQMQGPVGIGGLQLMLDGDRVELTASDGRQLESAAAWAELEGRLGAPVPAQKLRYWLLGLPAPGPFQWLSKESPATLQQDGWQIVYERSTVQSGTQLPARLTATNGASRVRLVIDHWTLGPEQP